MGSFHSWSFLHLSVIWISAIIFFTSVQLLHKLSIRGVNGPEKLLKVIKVSFWFYTFFFSLTSFDSRSQNPVVDHLPPNTVKISMFLCFPSVGFPLNFSFVPQLSPETVQLNVCLNIYPLYLQHTISLFSSVPWHEAGTTSQMPMSMRRLVSVNMRWVPVWLVGRYFFFPSFYIFCCRG